MEQRVKELLEGMPDSPPRMWTVDDYVRMIKKLDLGEYEQTFRARDLRQVQQEREKDPKWRRKGNGNTSLLKLVDGRFQEETSEVEGENKFDRIDFRQAFKTVGSSPILQKDKLVVFKA